VAEHIEAFKAFASQNPSLTFQVTKVGCGLAGFTEEQIAPLFFDAPSNILLPGTWTNLRQKAFGQAVAARLCVFGSRTFTDVSLAENHIQKSVDKLLSKGFDKVTIVSGGAKGADQLGWDFAKTNDLPALIFNANWNAYGKSAGHARNETMAWASTHAIGFWDGQSTGTKMMIGLLKRESIPVYLPTLPEKKAELGM
jgi:hypothetical protein